MKKTILIMFAAAVALSVSLVTVRAADEPMPSVGQMARDLALEIDRGRAGRAPHRVGGESTKLFHDVRIAKRFVDAGIDLVDDRGWRTVRRHDAVPGRRLETRQRFRYRRHVR